jgi:serine protease Do
MRSNKRALAAGLLMCSAVLLASVSVMAEVATPAAPPTAPIAATTPAVPAVALAPVATGGSLPELTTLIKQNSAAVVNISVEGGSMANALPEGLPPEFERFFRGLPEMKPQGRIDRKSVV